MIGQQARIVPVLLVLSLLVGCHGLFNPHVKLKRQFIDEDKVRKPVSMDVAFTYADLAIDEYNAAIGNNATFESSSGLAFLVLGAGAVGTAASGGLQDDVAALGIAGGSAFGIGSWLSNKPRRLVYAAGAGAMTCAKQVMLPYKIAPDDYARFTEALDRLASSLPAVKGITGAERQATAYEALVQSGDALRSQLDQAAELLVATVDRIGSEVNKALTLTSPDLSAVPALLEGIASGYGQVDVPELPTPTDPTVAGQLAGISTDSSALSSASSGKQAPAVCNNPEECAQIVQGTIRRFSASLPFEQLKACGVSEAIVAPIAIKPNNLIEIEAADGNVERRIIEGGSGRFVVSLLTEKTNAPVVRQPTPLGARIEVVVTKDTPAETYHALVTDVASNRKDYFEIRVTKPPQSD